MRYFDQLESKQKTFQIHCNVNDVAQYAIYKSAQEAKPISNLRLQKLLYFFWKDFYKQNRQYLFIEPFSAWKFGPVQVDVYFNYYMYGAAPINDIDFSKYYAQNLSKEVKDFIDYEINEYAPYSIYDLVNKTHEPNGAWDRVFQNGDGNNSRIPFNYIVDDINNDR